MRRLFVIALSFLALLSTGARADDCTLHQYASLPIIANVDGLPVVEAQIDGGTFRLLADTGGIYSLLRKDIADSLKLSPHPIRNGSEIYDASGTRIRDYVEAPGFKLGPIALDKFPMMVQSNPLISKAIDGTLAVDFLSRFDVEIDFANRKLNLFSPDHCPGKVVYWSSSYADAPFKIEGMHIVVPVTLDGQTLQSILDTGSSLSSISEGVAHKVFGISSSSPGIESLPGAKPDDLVQNRFRFKSLSFNDVSISNPLLLLFPDKLAQGYTHEHDDKLALDPIYGVDLKSPSLTLGVDVLSKLHLYISYKEKMLYVTAADAH